MAEETKHPALVALAAAVSELLAWAPPDYDPDNAIITEFEGRTDAAEAAFDAGELSKAECAEFAALVRAADEKLEGLTLPHLPRGPLPRA
jgi:hypothetical protein